MSYCSRPTPEIRLEPYVIDTDGAYDPRLLLGLKGTMSEFELTLLRKRMLEAALAKARRGELRVLVPIGYVWSSELGLMLDPDRRVQAAVRIIFRLFDRLGRRGRSCCIYGTRA